MIRAIRGLLRLPRLSNLPPPFLKAPAAGFPLVSVLIPARDEAEALPSALESLLAQDYPSLEIIVVNDRSADATPAIVDAFAARDSRVHPVHVHELSSGWLGKPHALISGYQSASGDWLLFTDADVHYAPDAISRAVTLAQRNGWDYLTLLPKAIMHGFWEPVILTYWGIGFVTAFESWRVSDPNSRAYLGLGAFQLVTRAAYERLGTHRRLALEVVEDIMLGKLAKFSGARCGVGIATGYLTLRWYPGVRALIRGVTKNFYAAHDYRAGMLLSRVALSILFSIVPYAAAIFLEGWDRIFGAVCVAASMTIHAGSARQSGVSMAYAFSHPIGSVINCYMMLRSMALNLAHGGITWRGTFYPLRDLIAARRALPARPVSPAPR